MILHDLRSLMIIDESIVIRVVIVDILGSQASQA